MTQITKDQLKALRVSMDAALGQIAQDHGLEFLRTGNCSFDPSGSFTFKVDGLVAGAPRKEQTGYDRSASLYGLPPRGTKFTTRGLEYSIWGMNSTGSKIICDAENGKRYLWKTDEVLRILKAGAAS